MYILCAYVLRKKSHRVFIQVGVGGGENSENDKHGLTKTNDIGCHEFK